MAAGAGARPLEIGKSNPFMRKRSSENFASYSEIPKRKSPRRKEEKDVARSRRI